MGGTRLLLAKNVIKVSFKLNLILLKINTIQVWSSCDFDTNFLVTNDTYDLYLTF
jgi:hypothetical protein